MDTQNIMASPYHSKVRSTQNMGVPLFSCLGYGSFGKCKVFSENPNLSNLVDIQRSMKTLNKLCASDRVYTLFLKKRSYFHTALLKGFVHCRVGILDSL